MAGLNTDNNYWSSSQYNSNNAWNVNTNDGNMNNNNKNNNNYVRAFAALPALKYKILVYLRVVFCYERKKCNN